MDSKTQIIDKLAVLCLAQHWIRRPEQGGRMKRDQRQGRQGGGTELPAIAKDADVWTKEGGGRRGSKANQYPGLHKAHLGF